MSEDRTGCSFVKETKNTRGIVSLGRGGIL